MKGPCQLGHEPVKPVIPVGAKRTYSAGNVRNSGDKVHRAGAKQWEESANEKDTRTGVERSAGLRNAAGRISGRCTC